MADHLQHILPNIWSPVIIIRKLHRCEQTSFAEASLSFLGVGVPPSVHAGEPCWPTDANILVLRTG